MIAALPQLHQYVQQPHLVRLAGTVHYVNVFHQNLSVPADSNVNDSWCLTALFSTNIWLYQGRKVRGGELSLPSDILTSTLAAFLFSSHTKKERDREAHLNYYASADIRERQPSHHKTKINQIQHK